MSDGAQIWEPDSICVGDTLSFLAENVFGEVTKVFTDEFDCPVSVVVENYDGTWAAVDLALCRVCGHNPRH